ncbi:hypothetical protein FHW84_004473 [Dyella sp. SG562]|uniref:hypothetical protein n=1 Tax=Dyella sp. SG562 TaxID=2587017 RepID=UPI00141E1582|nr:hypothetical protein [Dyella sp. SG562]NII75862.1 hypothetical protein [Dyella sp. SG562]
MNLAPLTPVVVGVALAAIAALGSRTRHQVVDGRLVYKFPPALAYLMFGIGLLFVGAPFLPGAAGNMGFLKFASFLWLFALFAASVGAYFLKYRVTIEGGRVSVGSYFKREFSISDIVEAKRIDGSRSAQLEISLRNGRNVTISGLVADFDSLASMITGQRGRE